MNVNDDVNGAIPKSTKSRLDRALQFTDILLSRNDFQADVKGLRDAWGIPSCGLKNGDEFDRWYIELNQHEDDPTKFEQAVLTLIRGNKYGLDVTSYGPLWKYVTVNDTTQDSFIGSMPHVIRRYEKKTKKPVYAMYFYDHTTEAEVRTTFNQFKATYLKDKRQQLIPTVRLQKMQRAYELYESGMKWKQVADTVNDELGGNLGENDASKLVAQYKKHLKV